MIKKFRRAEICGAVLSTALFATAGLAQAPSEAQREAIRSQCLNDYMAHCSSVPPGGEASLQCLQKNMSGLSAGCAGAVRAAEAPSATNAESPPRTESAPAAAATGPAPAATPAKPAAQAAAKAANSPVNKPSEAQIAAIRSACRSDYGKVCAGVPAGGAAALQCLDKNKAKLSAGCGQAVSAASGGGTPSAAGGAPAAATVPPTAGAAASGLALRPMRPREELFVARSACGADIRSLCGGVMPGGGRIAQCLAANAGSLSPACKSVLAQFAAR
jgi:hypothetical protein